MTKLKSKRFSLRWISNTYNQIRRGLGRVFNFNKKINDPAAKFIHELNREAYKLNKKLVGKTNGLQEIPLDTSIYQQDKTQPQTPAAPNNIPATEPTVSQPPAHAQQLPQSSIDTETAKEFIDRLTSVEKKIDRFFNLIERRVVKNAKEINIRIKLNENTDHEQE